MNKNRIAYLSLIALCAVLLIAATRDVTDTIRYRNGAIISFDTSTSIKDEDNNWVLSQQSLGNLAKGAAAIGTLSPTTQTNYSVILSNGSDYQRIFTANTNANLTITNIISGRSVTLAMNAITSTVNCTVKFPANVLTNSSLVLTVTNGTMRIYNLIPLDGTDPTNIIVTAGDVYRR